jgi:hypothetical protein
MAPSVFGSSSMECFECRAVNPEGKRFCRECGGKLTLICPQCGAETQPSDKFRGECGREPAVPGEPPSQGVRQDTPRDLAEAHPPQRAEDGGERKQVTVLFSDLSGYTSMTETLDPVATAGSHPRSEGRNRAGRVCGGCFGIRS